MVIFPEACSTFARNTDRPLRCVHCHTSQQHRCGAPWPMAFGRGSGFSCGAIHIIEPQDTGHTVMLFSWCDLVLLWGTPTHRSPTQMDSDREKAPTVVRRSVHNIFVSQNTCFPFKEGGYIQRKLRGIPNEAARKTRTMIRQMWETSVVGKGSRKTRKKNKSSDTSEWMTKRAVRAETPGHHTPDAHQRHLTQLFDGENMATLGR